MGVQKKKVRTFYCLTALFCESKNMKSKSPLKFKLCNSNTQTTREFSVWNLKKLDHRKN